MIELVKTRFLFKKSIGVFMDFKEYLKTWKEYIPHLYHEHLSAASLGWQRLFRQRDKTL